MKTARDLLGFNIRRLRESGGLNQAELADLCGMSTNMIQKVEYGKTAPSPETIDKLVKGLKTSHAQLFVDGDELAPAPAETVAQMTPAQLYDLVASASKRDGAVNMEIERLKKELDAIPPEVREGWAAAAAEIKALCLVVLSPEEDVEPLLRALPYKKQEAILTALRALGLGPR